MGLHDIKNTLQEIATYPQIKENAELLGKIIELQNQMWELQQENQNLKEEIASFTKQIKRNEDFETKYKFDGKKYVSVENPNDRTQCICSACWDSKDTIARLIVNNMEYGTYYTCPVCKNKFTEQTDSQRAREIEPFRRMSF